MGVDSLFSLFISRVDDDNVIVEIPNNLYGLCVDFNGILHRIAADVYGYGKKLSGAPYTDSELDGLEAIDLVTLEHRYLNKLEEVMTKVFINTIVPSTYLILAVDGVAPFAKINQQRYRRFNSAYDRAENNHVVETITNEQKSIDITNHTVKRKVKFDTANITAGTPFMAKIHDRIDKWFRENVSLLPKYTYYLSHQIPGEGEHKMLNKLAEVERSIAEKEEISIEDFRKQPHGVYGMDSDLYFLSSIRPYNFYWIRESNSINQKPPSVSINTVRNFIVNKMSGYNDPDDLMRYMYDFTLLSYLIGDDFVPPMFTLDLNVGYTLLGFCSSYKKVFDKIFEETGQRYFLIAPDNNGKMGQIQWYQFYQFLTEFLPLEKEYYNIKARGQQLEKVDNNQAARDRNGKRGKYHQHPLLDIAYESFTSAWIPIIVDPIAITDVYQINPNENPVVSSYKHKCFSAISNQTNYNNNLQFIVNDYFTGLQWNIAYYMGLYHVNNWHYKNSLAPCIFHLYEYISNPDNQNNLPKLDDIIMKPNEHIVTPAQQLFTVLHFPYSVDLIKELKLSAYTTATKTKAMKLTDSRLEIMFPLNFPRIVEGKYTSNEHTKVTVLSRIDIDQIKLVTSKLSIPIVNKGLQYIDQSKFDNIYRPSKPVTRGISFAKENIMEPSRPSPRDHSFEREPSNGRGRGYSSEGRGRGRGSESYGRGSSERGRGYSSEREHSDGRGRGSSDGRGREHSDGRGRGRGNYSSGRVTYNTDRVYNTPTTEKIGFSTKISSKGIIPKKSIVRKSVSVNEEFEL